MIWALTEKAQKGKGISKVDVEVVLESECGAEKGENFCFSAFG